MAMSEFAKGFWTGAGVLVAVFVAGRIFRML